MAGAACAPSGPGALAVRVEPAGPNPLAVRLAFDRPGASVTCVAADDPDDVLVAAAGSGAEAVLAGLRPDVSYGCDAAAGSVHAELPLSVSLADAGVEPPPTFAISGDPDAGPWTAFVTTTRGRLGWDRLWVADPRGRPRMTLALARDPDDEAAWGVSPGVFAEPVPGGLLVGGGLSHPPAIVDVTGAAVVAAPLASGVASHDAAYLAGDGEGQVVAVTWDARTDGDAGERTEFAIERVDLATGAPSWTWRSVDAVAAGQLAYDPVQLALGDPWHANGLEVDADGLVWVSLRNLDALIAVDPATDAVVRRFGLGPGADGDDSGVVVAAEGDAFYGQHDPSRADGPDGERLLLLDNGRTARPSSRVVEYALPPGDGGGIALVARSWTEPDWYEPAMGGVSALPGGDWLVCRAHCYTCTNNDPDAVAQLIRVDADAGSVRWRAELPDRDTTVYRARPVDPCALGLSLAACADR